MAETIHVSVAMTHKHCYRCGILFGVPTDFDEQRLRDGRSFWCPNGHGQIYGDDPKPEQDKPTDTSLTDRQQKIRDLHEMEQAEARLADRAAGVEPAAKPKADTCPVCGRVFKFPRCLTKHVKRKHPEHHQAAVG